MNLLDSRGPRSCTACGASLEVSTADGELTIEGPSLPPLPDGLSEETDGRSTTGYRERDEVHLVLRWQGPRETPDHTLSLPLAGLVACCVASAALSLYLSKLVAQWILGGGLVAFLIVMVALGTRRARFGLLLAGREIRRLGPVERRATVAGSSELWVSGPTDAGFTVRAKSEDGQESELAAALPSRRAALYVAARLRAAVVGASGQSSE